MEKYEVERLLLKATPHLSELYCAFPGPHFIRDIFHIQSGIYENIGIFCALSVFKENVDPQEHTLVYS